MSSSMKSDQTPSEPLPESFTPGDRDVVIGKGKKFFKHEGNRYLRTLIASMLDEYSMAQTKPDKSNIISDVVDHVRKTGRFVKRDPNNGQWVYAEDLLCREKCSQCFRDSLHQSYRSSNVSKKNKRRRELERQYEEELRDTEAMMRNPEAKRMRTEPGPIPPLPTPQHLFDWEMSPVTPKPRIFRRASDLTGNMVSLLVDNFGGFGNTENQDENPFEPTPLPCAPDFTQSGNDDFWNNFTNDAEMKCADRPVSFEPRPLFDSLLQDDSLPDISFRSDFMDGSLPFQPQSQQGRNTTAAFAA